MNEIESNPHVSHAGADGTPGPNNGQVANLAYLICLFKGRPEGRDKSNGMMPNRSYRGSSTWLTSVPGELKAMQLTQKLTEDSFEFGR
jgi:hypothetical protein